MKGDNIFIQGSQLNVERRDIVNFISNHLDSNLYSKTELITPDRNRPDKIFNSNLDFWREILGDNCYPEQVIKLQKFHLTEWIPIAPGLFFTDEAERSRIDAQRNAVFHNKETFESRFKTSINNEARWDSAEFERIINSLGEDFIKKQFLEYNPDGKESMLRGGIGSLRLADKFINGRECYILGASSTGVSHEGIPLLVETYLYQETISKIKDNGGFLVNLIGRLKVIPRELSLIRTYRSNPRYCLYVENIEFFEPSKKEDLYASAVISYYPAKHFFDQRVSFCYFSPDKNDKGLLKAVDWLEDYVSRYSDTTSVIIEGDFDEYREHFERVDFPIREISNGRISRETLLKYKDFFHFEINETIMNNNFENISNSTIVVGSSNVTIGPSSQNRGDIQKKEQAETLEKSEVQNLIANGKLGKALTLILAYFKNNGNSEARNEVIQYNSQFSELRRKENLGTVSNDDANREKARITKGLIELVDENM